MRVSRIEDILAHAAEGRTLYGRRFPLDPQDPAAHDAQVREAVTQAEGWGEHVLHAEDLEAVLSDPELKARVGRHGVLLSGFRIVAEGGADERPGGVINLYNVDLDFPVRLQNCRIEARIRLRQSRTRTIDLVGSYLEAFSGRRMEIAGDLDMQRCVVARYTAVDGAHIKGWADFRAAHLMANRRTLPLTDQPLTRELINSVALNLSVARVDNDLRMADALADGVVLLTDAQIGNLANFNGLTVRARLPVAAEKAPPYAEDWGPGDTDASAYEGDAIKGSGLLARGNLYLNGARIYGQIRLPGARVEGRLEGYDLHIFGSESRSLNLDFVNVQEDVWLSARPRKRTRAVDAPIIADQGTYFHGCVRMRKAHVGGDLRFDGARFDAKGYRNGFCFRGTGLTVDGELRCFETESLGNFDLANADIKLKLRIRHSRFSWLEIDRRELTREINAAIEANHLRVGSNLHCEGSTIEGPFYLQDAEIEGSAFFTSSLDRPLIMRAPEGLALVGRRLSVGADVTISGRKETLAAEETSEHRAQIEGSVYFTDAKIQGRLALSFCTLTIAEEEAERAAKRAQMAELLPAGLAGGHPRRAFDAQDKGSAPSPSGETGSDEETWLRSISMPGSLAQTHDHEVNVALGARGAVIGRSIDLKDGLTVFGQIRLIEAQVGDDLRLLDSVLVAGPEDGRAVALDRARFGGSVVIGDLGARTEGRYSLECFGSMRMVGCQVGDFVRIQSARIVANSNIRKLLDKEPELKDLSPALREWSGTRNDRALDADLIHVGKDFYCLGEEGLSSDAYEEARAQGRHNLCVLGLFSLEDAQIQGALNLRAAEIASHEDCSILGSGITVGANIQLERGFRTLGCIDLSRGTIDGNLSIQEAEIGARVAASPNVQRPALNGQSLKIGLDLDIVDTVLNGLSDFVQAEVTGSVEIINTTLLSPLAAGLSNDPVALSLSGAKVGRNVKLCDSSRFQGTADFSGVDIGYDFIFYLRAFGAPFFHGAQSAAALSAHRMRVAGTFFWGVKPSAVGVGEPVDATAMRSDPGTRPRGALPGIVDLLDAQVDTLRDTPQDWPMKGRLILDGFRYNRIAGDSPLEAADRIEWLNLQDPHYFKTFHPQPFEQLVRTLSDMGRLRAAESIDVAKQNIETWRLRNVWRFWVPIFSIMTRYGYQPWRAIVLLVAFVMFGWWVFHTAAPIPVERSSDPIISAYRLDPSLSARGFVAVESCITPAEEEYYTGFLPDLREKLEGIPDGVKILPKDYPKFHAGTYALDSFLPIVDLHMERYWLPDTGTRCRLKAHWPSFVAPPADGSVMTLLNPGNWRVERGAAIMIGTWQPQVSYKDYLMLHIALGWFLTTLAVAAVAGLVRNRINPDA